MPEFTARVLSRSACGRLGRDKSGVERSVRARLLKSQDDLEAFEALASRYPWIAAGVYERLRSPARRVVEAVVERVVRNADAIRADELVPGTKAYEALRKRLWRAGAERPP